MGWPAMRFEDGGVAALTPAGAVSCGIECLYVDCLAICANYFDVDHPRKGEQLTDCAPDAGGPELGAILLVHRVDGAIDRACVDDTIQHRRRDLDRTRCRNMPEFVAGVSIEGVEIAAREAT